MNRVKKLIKQKLFLQYGQSAIVEKEDFKMKKIYLFSDADYKFLQNQLNKIVYNVEKISVQNESIEEICNLENSEIYAFMNFICLGTQKKENFREFKKLYKICQFQADYYIKNKKIGKIVNLIRTSEISGTEAYYCKCLIEGLARALGHHGISINGIISKSNVEHESEHAWVLYLLSQFGTVVSGQAIVLGTTQENLEYNFPQTF